MRITPTKAQEASLAKLFSGNQVDVERVISAQRPEMRGHLRELAKARSNMDKLIQILFLDLKRTTQEMKAHPEDQYWRRAAIRAVAITIDGIIYCLKQTTVPNAQLNQVKFKDEELFFLREKIEQKNKPAKTKFVNFRENVKGTFKLFAAAFKCPCPTNFNDAGFAALCETYELRHRLVHPRNYMTFCVTDKEKQKTADAILWLHTEIQNLFDGCSRSLDDARS